MDRILFTLRLLQVWSRECSVLLRRVAIYWPLFLLVICTSLSVCYIYLRYSKSYYREVTYTLVSKDLNFGPGKTRQWVDLIGKNESVINDQADHSPKGAIRKTIKISEYAIGLTFKSSKIVTDSLTTSTLLEFERRAQAILPADINLYRINDVFGINRPGSNTPYLITLAIALLLCLLALSLSAPYVFRPFFKMEKGGIPFLGFWGEPKNVKLVMHSIDTMTKDRANNRIILVNDMGAQNSFSHYLA
ncbi:MAG: hypothetical protein EOO01_35055, partial [Chitinophagaceae bacterium]